MTQPGEPQEETERPPSVTPPSAAAAEIAPDHETPEADTESLKLTPQLLLLGILAVAIGLGAGLVMSSMVWK